MPKKHKPKQNGESSLSIPCFFLTFSEITRLSAPGRLTAHSCVPGTVIGDYFPVHRKVNAFLTKKQQLKSSPYGDFCIIHCELLTRSGFLLHSEIREWQTLQVPCLVVQSQDYLPASKSWRKGKCLLHLGFFCKMEMAPGHCHFFVCTPCCFTCVFAALRLKSPKRCGCLVQDLSQWLELMQALGQGMPALCCWRQGGTSGRQFHTACSVFSWEPAGNAEGLYAVSDLFSSVHWQLQTEVFPHTNWCKLGQD